MAAASRDPCRIQLPCKGTAAQDGTVLPQESAAHLKDDVPRGSEVLMFSLLPAMKPSMTFCSQASADVQSTVHFRISGQAT